MTKHNGPTGVNLAIMSNLKKQVLEHRKVFFLFQRHKNYKKRRDRLANIRNRKI